MMWEITHCDDGYWEAYPIISERVKSRSALPIGRGDTIWEAITKSSIDLRKIYRDDGKDFLVF